MENKEKQLVYTVSYKNTDVVFKLYELLTNKKISYRTFRKETETDYRTFKNYARGVNQKIDFLILERWCEYLECTISDIVEFKDTTKKEPK